jgi:hypothetical protein
MAMSLVMASRFFPKVAYWFWCAASRNLESSSLLPRRAQDNNFYKNLAIMGGLVFAPRNRNVTVTESYSLTVAESAYGA